MTWLERLRRSIQSSGKKHSTIAAAAGIAPETLSRIITGKHEQPNFQTVVRLAHALGISVGWLLQERGYALSPDQIRDLRRAAKIIDDVTKDS